MKFSTSPAKKSPPGNYGIEIKFVQIKSIELPVHRLPGRLRPHESGAHQAGQRHHADAQARSIEIRSEADSQASKLLAEADAQAKEIRGQGQQAMIQSLQVMSQNPESRQVPHGPEHDGGIEQGQNHLDFRPQHHRAGVLQAAKPSGASATKPRRLHPQLAFAQPALTHERTGIQPVEAAGRPARAGTAGRR